MLTIAWVLACLAMAVGVFLGARGMLDPAWASRLVRLEESRAGGRAEFRATYGGVFLGLHLAGLALAVQFLRTESPIIGASAGGAAAALAAGWAGSAAGRLLSMARDPGANTQFNALSVGFELVIAALLAAPWFVGLFLT